LVGFFHVKINIQYIPAKRKKQLITICLKPLHAMYRIKTKNDHDMGESETKAEPMMPVPGSTAVIG
jgi:hypothetical protein